MFYVNKRDGEVGLKNFYLLLIYFQALAPEPKSRVIWILHENI